MGGIDSSSVFGSGRNTKVVSIEKFIKTFNNKLETKKLLNTKQIDKIFNQISSNQSIKIKDRTHGTYLFFGKEINDLDHTVYSCKEKGFKNNNTFQQRTSFSIFSNNDGSYQIRDNDYQCFLFVGNNLDIYGDHYIYGSEQKNWINNENFLYKISVIFEPAENGGWRIFDKMHNSYLFVSFLNILGDHTLFSVSLSKFESNRNEWEKRTIFDVVCDGDYSSNVTVDTVNTTYTSNI